MSAPSILPMIISKARNGLCRNAHYLALLPLLPGVLLAQPLHIVLVPAMGIGPHCKDALVRNLTSTTLQVTLNYVVKGNNGAYFSNSTSIGGGTFNGGANTGYYMTGLAPGAETRVSVHSSPSVSCDIPQSVEYSYTTFNVDAHNAKVSSNESAERRALGSLIGRGLEDTNSQRAREREAQRRAESARQEAEAKSKRQQEHQQLMQRSMEANRRAGEATMREIEAGRARQNAEYEAERRRVEAEMARGQIERDNYNRAAAAEAARQQAEWQARQVAAQRAAQAAEQRRQAEAAARAAAERRRQIEWQQSVDMTSALLQSSTQKSEQALAEANNQLEQVVASYGSEDEEMARILAQAKAEAAQKSPRKRARPQ